MNCIEAQKYMSIYIDGELDCDKEEELLKHLGECRDCFEFFNLQKSMDLAFKDIFSEKDIPEDFKENIIKKLPEREKENVFNRKKIKVLTAVAAVIIAMIIPFGGEPLVFRLINTATLGSSAKFDLEILIKLNDITYIYSRDVISDESVIGEEIARVKKTITEKNYNAKLLNGYATHLPVGTPIYSLKGIDKEEAVAAKLDGRWVVYKPNQQERQFKALNNADNYNAKKIVVTYDLGNGEVTREITNKDSIRVIADYLKNVRDVRPMHYFERKPFEFYFYIEDEQGKGKIAEKISGAFNDPKLGGYISYQNHLRISPEIMKLLVPEEVENGYDTALGGLYQIYDVFLSQKILISRYTLVQYPYTPEVRVLSKDEKLIKDGKEVEDYLAGNYKLMIKMQNTTVKPNALEKLKKDFKSIPGAVSLDAVCGETESDTIIYIGFDNKPEYIFEEYAENLMIVLK